MIVPSPPMSTSYKMLDTVIFKSESTHLHRTKLTYQSPNALGLECGGVLSRIAFSIRMRSKREYFATRRECGNSIVATRELCDYWTLDRLRGSVDRYF